jgi:hypothetical protein
MDYSTSICCRGDVLNKPLTSNVLFHVYLLPRWRAYRTPDQQWIIPRLFVAAVTCLPNHCLAMVVFVTVCTLHDERQCLTEHWRRMISSFVLTCHQCGLSLQIVSAISWKTQYALCLHRSVCTEHESPCRKQRFAIPLLNFRTKKKERLDFAPYHCSARQSCVVFIARVAPYWLSYWYEVGR